MQTHFEGIWVPIITPFSDDGVDHSSLARLAQHLADQGIAGIFAGATTGEGALLRTGEQEAIFTTLRAAVSQLPTVLGISQASTEVAALQARNLYVATRWAAGNTSNLCAANPTRHSTAF